MSQGKESFEKVWNAALQYLSYRPRSETELRIRLRRKGFDVDIIEQALKKLREQHLVNNGAFAQFWKENRETFSPRSRQLIEQELKQKGVSKEVIVEATSELDDELNAYKAAQKKLPYLVGLDYMSFRQKLSAFLGRRGFAYEVTKRTVDRLWHEIEFKRTKGFDLVEESFDQKRGEEKC
jgi:regulatory protein